MSNKTALIYNANGVIILTGTMAEDSVTLWAEKNAQTANNSYLIVDDPVDPTQWQVQNGQLVPTPQSVLTANQWTVVKYKRDSLLSETDWHVTKAVETGQPINQDWANYRQQLRDITTQSDPFNIVWPTPPDSGGFNPTE